MEAVIFVGVQGSGKTTFYRERFADTHVRISLDMLRTRRREQLLLDACLQGKQSFVIDNTNPLPSDRVRYIGPARTGGFQVVAYYFETSLQDAIRRNDQRAGKKKIPVAAVAGTFKRTQPPKLAEGFDALYVVTISAEGSFAVAGPRAKSGSAS
ncbi:MAG TPA: ATP-binding protein [Candidatus Acidoferrales bacterium]|nr:ATP-binding protein [Candidatus Acidoferrales bacterium]